MSFSAFKKRMALMFAGKKAESSNNEYIAAWHSELVREMELEGIDSRSSMTEVKAWLLRQTDGVIYQTHKSKAERLPYEVPEVYLFRLHCKRALSQMVRDGVFKITDTREKK